ncbi:MAG: hypothetical protein ACRCYS_19585 [Beijerinckiaceae bacterium]
MAAVIVDAFAIVSADDRIADAQGRFPPALMNDADWIYFQNELDQCDFTVVGRASHEATPNVKNRRRIIMSRAVRGLEAHEDGHWWNPADMAWRAVCVALLPRGGRVGVPGGQAAFDYFLRDGLSSFHLSRANRVMIPDGRGVFAAVEQGQRADDCLRHAGLVADPLRMIDAAADVTLTVWRK